MSWRLNRATQCAKCPWRVDVNPQEIPDGYSVEKHRHLKGTIARPGDVSSLSKPLRAMACHETAKDYCIGWLVNQTGSGNNIALRMRMMDCKNGKDVKTIGEQHEQFEDTIPIVKKLDPIQPPVASPVPQ